MTDDRINRFRTGLEELINCESLEGRSGTPDFILADLLTTVLVAYETATQRRAEFYSAKNTIFHGMPEEENQVGPS